MRVRFYKTCMRPILRYVTETFKTKQLMRSEMKILRTNNKQHLKRRGGRIHILDLETAIERSLQTESSGRQKRDG